MALLGCAAQASRAPTGTSAERAPADDAVGGGATLEPRVQQQGASDASDDSIPLLDEQRLALDALDEALELANCDDAFRHRDAICELSERICTIAEDHPRAAERCEDAETRCANARERVADECG